MYPLVHSSYSNSLYLYILYTFFSTTLGYAKYFVWYDCKNQELNVYDGCELPFFILMLLNTVHSIFQFVMKLLPFWGIAQKNLYFLFKKNAASFNN